MPKENIMDCPDCGLSYVSSVPEDFRFHKKYHDKIVNGVPTRQSNSDQVIWHKDLYRITIVNYSSPMTQKRRAQEAGLVARHDTRFDFAPYHAKEKPDKRNIHLFLLYRINRIVGLLIIEMRSHIWKCTWTQYENHEAEELPNHPPIWSVGLVWVHRRYRRVGLAQRLIFEAASFLDADTQAIGWYTPFTESGEALVRRCCPHFIYIAK